MKSIKASELKELNAQELEAKLAETRDNLFKLTVRKETRQLEDAVSVRVARRDVARVATVLKQKSQAAKGGEAKPAKAEKADAAAKE